MPGCGAAAGGRLLDRDRLDPGAARLSRRAAHASSSVQPDHPREGRQAMPFAQGIASRWSLALLTVGLLLGGAAQAAAPAAPASPLRPSIVVILTDDEDLASHRFMPKTKALLEDQGAVFDNY